MKITIKNIDETFKVLENIDKKKAKKAIGIVTQDVYENTKTLAKPHIVTGILERNIRHKIGVEGGIVWIDDENMLVNWKGKKINYANFVLYGSRPHKIEAKKKKALRFSYKNLDEFIYRKSVYHPGYRGDNFLKKAVEKTFSKLDFLLKGV
jgi:phage pi2 protein 07